MKKEKIKKICVICGKNFEVHPYRENTAKCCSCKCVVLYRLEKVGSPIKGKKWNKKSRKKLSEALKGKNIGNTNGFKKGMIPWNKGVKRTDIVGKNHWNWQGGITTENTKVRTSVEYKAWRLNVYKRDWFTCKMPKCGYKGRNIESHHIKKVKDFPELILDVDNGITLCQGCHLPTRNKEEQYEELFSNMIQPQEI